jgi:hypothetical protein
MLASRLPLKVPIQLQFENIAYWNSLSSHDKNDVERRYHDLDRQFRQDTKKNPMNVNLGNLDAEGIHTKVCNCFQANPKKRFCGNGAASKTNFLSFIKYLQASLPSDPQGKGILGLVKKAMGCNHGENNRDNTRNLQGTYLSIWMALSTSTRKNTLQKNKHCLPPQLRRILQL